MEAARTTLAGSPTLASGTYTIVSAATSGTDYTGVSVTAPGFDGTVASSTIISGALSQLLVTLTPANGLYWDGDAPGNTGNATVDGGSGTWSSAATNWTRADGSTNGMLSGATITPFFQGMAGTVDVSGSVTAAGMTFATDGYLLTGGTIHLTASPSTITTDSGVGATIASSLTGSGALYKDGAGSLLLSGTNNFSGAAIAGGTLTADGSAAISDSAAVTVNTGAAFQLAASETIGALSGAGNVLLGSNSLTAGDATDTSLSGTISGSGSFAKAGSGMLTLAGNSGGFTGTTSITAGTLHVTGTIGAVSIALGATLSGTGTVGAIVNGGTVANGTKGAAVRPWLKASAASHSSCSTERRVPSPACRKQPAAATAALPGAIPVSGAVRWSPRDATAATVPPPA